MLVSPRNYRLKGELAIVTRDGSDHERWQHKPTLHGQDLVEVLDSVVDDREEAVITRAGREPAVVVSFDDYESLKESAYLLRSPVNARRILASIDELEAGHDRQQDLLD